MPQYVYCLCEVGSEKPYTGMTNNITRRVRQHNGEVKGGAKYTRGRKWRLCFYVTGNAFTRKHAASLEWHLKHAHRGGKKCYRASGRKGHSAPRRMYQAMVEANLCQSTGWKGVYRRAWLLTGLKNMPWPSRGLKFEFTTRAGSDLALRVKTREPN